ncbi:MAG: hypothetical protein JWM64_94, partial [Frankiales bacterium]|nr:hypothetical protein [Frankiales bacterium]
WRSLVARCVRDAEVAGSNPVTPTSSPPDETGRPRGRPFLVPGVSSPCRAHRLPCGVPDAVLLALGAAAALGLALLAARRAPGLATGVGLVLLLVAALRALAETALLVSSDRGADPLLVAGGVVVGATAWLLVRGRPALRTGAGPLAVLLAQVPLLASFTVPAGLPADATVLGPADGLLLLLAGLLAGGAVAACRPGAVVAVVALVLLAGELLLVRAVDPEVLTPLAAGAAVAVLVPLLLEQAALPGVRGQRLALGAVLGVALVLAAAALPAATSDGMPRRYADYQGLDLAEPGLQVVSNEDMGSAYRSSLTLDFDRPRLLPGLSLLERRSSVFGWFAYAPLQSNG